MQHKSKAMKLKDTQELRSLVEISGKTIDEVSEIVISSLIKSEIISEDPSNWGVSVFDAIEWNTSQIKLYRCFYDIISELEIKLDFRKLVPILNDLTLLGDDGCPECGGYMEVVDGDYDKCGMVDYDIPQDVVTNWERVKCNNCGHCEIIY